MYLFLVGYLPFVQDGLVCAFWPGVAVNRAPFTLKPVPVWMINYKVPVASGDEEVSS